MKEIITLFTTVLVALVLALIGKTVETASKLSLAFAILIVLLYYFDITAVIFTQSGTNYSINHG
jgi:hypothetical protein